MNIDDLKASRADTRHKVIKPSGNQAQISADIEAFINAGGRIQVLGNGISSDNPMKKHTEQENRDRERARLGRMFNPEDKR